MKYSRAINSAKKYASVIEVDWRYNRFGLSAASAVAVNAAASDSKMRLTAANRKTPPAIKETAAGNAAAIPLRHQASTRANGMIARCGRGSHGVPSWSYPGVRESKRRRALLRCASASPYHWRHPRLKKYQTAAALRIE